MNSSSDNPSFEHDEDTSGNKNPFNELPDNEPSQIDSDKLSPIVRQTNPYYESFDSISMYTESTVPSEFAEMEVHAHEYRKNQRLAATAGLENESKQQSNIQYNLRFDKVVIVGGNLHYIYIHKFSYRCLFTSYIFIIIKRMRRRTSTLISQSLMQLMK
jgi:hypothetical protein